AIATTTLPDGTPIAITTSNDNTVHLWDLTTHTCLDVIHLPDSVSALAVHNQRIICGSGKDIFVFCHSGIRKDGETDDLHR
ncbi:hypothetical protein ACFVWN_06615, partial [Nocardiopsis flavescens]